MLARMRTLVPALVVPSTGRTRPVPGAQGRVAVLLRRLPAPIRARVRDVGTIAARHGWHAYAVGGFVRDLLLGRPTLDIDVMVEGDGPRCAAALATTWDAAYWSHAAFGTATVETRDGQRVDVATARRETYPRPAALPRVEPSTLAEDLSRRDFTVNALALDLAPGRFGRLIDPFGGLDDLQNSLLRALHERSFVDDPTRAFRAVRYAYRLGCRLAPRTRAWILDLAASGRLGQLSGARLKNELRLLAGEVPLGVLAARLERLRLWEAIHPALGRDRHLVGRLRQGERALAWARARGVPEAGERWLVFLALLLWSLPPATRAAVAERLTLRERGEVRLQRALPRTRRAGRTLQAARRPSVIARSLDMVPAAAILALRAVGPPAARRAAEQYLRRHRIIRMRTTGRHLAALGLAPGPIYRRVLAQVRDAVLDGRVRSARGETDLAARLVRQAIQTQEKRAASWKKNYSASR